MEEYLSIIFASVGPIATVGAIYATFQRLRQDVADHARADLAEFHAIRESLSHLRERLSALDGGPYGHQ